MKTKGENLISPTYKVPFFFKENKSGRQVTKIIKHDVRINKDAVLPIHFTY